MDNGLDKRINFLMEEYMDYFILFENYLKKKVRNIKLEIIIKTV